MIQGTISRKSQSTYRGGETNRKRKVSVALLLSTMILYGFGNPTPSIRLLGNTDQAEELLIGLTRDNSKLITDLYGVIQLINTEVIADNQINLRVLVPEKFLISNSWISVEDKSLNPQKSLSNLIGTLRTLRGVPPPVRLPNFSTTPTAGAGTFWIQDLVKWGWQDGSASAKERRVLLDLNADNDSDLQVSVRDFAQGFSGTILPIRTSQSAGFALGNNGNRGGNIDVTHEGKAFVGDKATPDFIKSLTTVLGNKPIIIPTAWLAVGHVDEILQFVPTQDACKGGILHADPLDGLKQILASPDWKKPSRDDVKDSLTYFLRKPLNTRQHASLKLQDFNINKPLRTNKIGASRYSDWFVRANLEAAHSIASAVITLQKASRCLKTIIPLPTVLRELDPETPYSPLGLVVHNPLTNAVVINGHVIFPLGEFSEIVRERVAPHIGGSDRVHFVDAMSYQRLGGSLHCATTVIRRPFTLPNSSE